MSRRRCCRAEVSRTAVQLFWSAEFLGSAVGCCSGMDWAVRIAATHLGFAHTLDLAP